MKSDYVDIQLVQNVQNLHEKKNPQTQEGCEALEIDKDDRQGKCGESEQHGASTYCHLNSDGL